jgi:hypothetical protein
MCSKDFHIRLSSVVQDQMAALPPPRRGLVESVIREIKTRATEGGSHDVYKDSLLDGLPGAEEYKIYHRFGISIIYVVENFKIFIDNIEITTPPNGGGDAGGVPRSVTPTTDFFDHANATLPVYWVLTNMLVRQGAPTCHSPITGSGGLLPITDSVADAIQLALNSEPSAPHVANADAYSGTHLSRSFGRSGGRSFDGGISTVGRSWAYDGSINGGIGYRSDGLGPTPHGQIHVGDACLMTPPVCWTNLNSLW